MIPGNRIDVCVCFFELFQEKSLVMGLIFTFASSGLSSGRRSASSSADRVAGRDGREIDRETAVGALQPECKTSKKDFSEKGRKMIRKAEVYYGSSAARMSDYRP